MNPALKSLKPQISKFLLRLPTPIYKQLEKQSQKTMYSINLLIIEAIKNSIKNNGQ